MEFDIFVDKFRNVGVNVIVESDDKLVDILDLIFLNNWVSFYVNGDIVFYLMFVENCRKERWEEVFMWLEEEGFKIENLVDYIEVEKEDIFLEGIGSIVMDRVNKKVYCVLLFCVDEELFIEFCEDFEYILVVFMVN